MNRSMLGGCLVLLIGVAGMLLYWWLRPGLEKAAQQQMSDAQVKLTLRIGGDDYLGYFFLTSSEMRKQCARRGIAIDFHDDGGVYAERLQRFAEKSYDCIVLPVNSYVQHGQASGYPGVITAAICESKGADGILAVANKFPSGKVQDLNDATLKWVYTPESPSSYLINLLISDFDLYQLAQSNQWRNEVNGSRAVLERARQGAGDVFVLWEPQLSQALGEVPNLKYVWGSDKFAGYIIDVFVFHRDFLRRNEVEVQQFLEAYFQVLQTYQNDRPRLLQELKDNRDLKAEAAAAMLGKIDYFDLLENCRRQFGLPLGPGLQGAEGVVNCILAAEDKLSRAGELTGSRPEGWPYVLVYSELLKKLLVSAPRSSGGLAGAADFKPLNEQQWDDLKEVGTIRVDPIAFQAGTGALSEEGEQQVDRLAALLINNYPDYRVAIRGHTGAGDEDENRKLSQERADAVARRLIEQFAVDSDRLRVEGLGSTQPPERRAGETFRQFQYRLPRVEFVLLEESRL